MIISNIIGGLGNQMFQYAAARDLSLRKRLPLKLDVSAFSYYELHNGFELDRVFRCPIDMARQEDVQKVLGWQSSVRVQNFMSRPWLAPLKSKSLVIETGQLSSADLDGVPQNCYLRGYWQSEKYFSHSAEQIRKDFTFRQPMNELNALMVEKILSVNAISIHIRRGDYVSNKSANATHGICSIQYYRKAIKTILKNIEKPEFFIFSDDIAWVKNSLKIDGLVHYIDFNRNLQSFNDMRLMSFCKHHIVANSSFSWWGAWLNPSPTKLVIAPKPWFANPLLESSDLIPENWIREAN